MHEFQQKKFTFESLTCALRAQVSISHVLKYHKIKLQINIKIKK